MKFASLTLHSPVRCLARQTSHSATQPHLEVAGMPDPKSRKCARLIIAGSFCRQTEVNKG